MLYILTKKRCRRRRGFSIAECVIVMAVLMLAIWAILSTAAWSTEVYVMTHRQIGARVLASSWFEVFETLDPDPASFDMDAASKTVAMTLSPNATGNATQGFFVNGHLVRARESSESNGVRVVELSVWAGDTHGLPLTFNKRVNSRSNAGVPDDSRG